MNERKYVPVLKWKAGEKAALERLTVDQKSFICPLIEVYDLEDEATIIRDLARLKEVPCYLDTSYVEDDVSLLATLIRESRTNGTVVSPVLYPHNFPQDADVLLQFSDRILFRVTVPEDIDGESYESIFKSISNWMSGKNVLVDVMLDLCYIKDRNTANLMLSDLRNVLSKYIVSNNDFGNIIVASTCFPETLENLAAGEDLFINRYEMKIFKKIYDDDQFDVIKERLIFSDYGVTRFTETELDFSRIKYAPLPKVRYTIHEKYWILKGKRNNVTKQSIRSYSTMAREIFESENYYGETFSFGDQEIKERAFSINGKGPGNHTNWVTIAANHHIAVVVEELSNLLDA